jgi:hypothetical protein
MDYRKGKIVMTKSIDSDPVVWAWYIYFINPKARSSRNFTTDVLTIFPLFESRSKCQKKEKLKRKKNGTN